METVHTHGVWMAEALQRGTIEYEKLWLFVTHMGDPKAAFLLHFPMMYYVNRRTGIAVVWVAAISEWLNLVFKWMLFGERPFWWVGESRLFIENPPQVQQFPATCETGPGSPSGHAMVTGGVWWVMASALASFLHSRTRSRLLRAVPYLLYLLVLVAVGLSRIFILAHFPHQVVAGSLTGFALGLALNHTVPEWQPLLFFVRWCMGLLVGALLLHVGLEHLGVDLSWSIALAKRWCSQSEWIRPDTAPLSSLTRDCGAMLGLGLAQFWKPGGWTLPWVPRALCLALSSLALYHVNRVPLPTSPPFLFYSLYFIRFALLPQVVMVFVPGFVHLLTAKNKKD
ncbi:glucose-6-phosphatase 3 [Megalops cyprinoides]|uniref:glucose-6-phosphatase 3 n=1 Tax=Megalops cyprinoides TaxID=118141 RepID=UPI001863B855|nr:glucose-6-phosphatase 3 [Megalops cyprinoides]XP_036398861.1 glucose-6-phosphatase 3 [Megalops cyprinoides]